MLESLTLFEETFHLLTCLIVVDEDIKPKALEALEQLAGISICTITYIHPCLKTHKQPPQDESAWHIDMNKIRQMLFLYLSSHQSFCC